MNNKVKKVRDIFIEFAGNVGVGLGLSKLTTQLYALLYIASEPISLDEMAEYLKMSKGSASVNIRILQEWGAVKKVLRMGSRRDYYEADRNVIKVIGNRLKAGIKRRLDELNEGIQNIEEMLNKSTNNLTEENNKILQTYKSRLKEVKKMSAKINQLLRLVKFPFI